MVSEVPRANELVLGLANGVLGGSALIVANHWIDTQLFEQANFVVQLAKGKPGAKPAKKEKLTKQQLKELKEQVFIHSLIVKRL